MILGDVLLERCIASDTLRAAIARAFSLPDEQVAIVTSMENAPALAGVTVDTRELGGQFPMQLAIYVSDAGSVQLVDVTIKLAQELAVRALVPSDSVNPYKMILIREDGSSSEVDIDTHRIDDLGEYWVSQ